MIDDAEIAELRLPPTLDNLMRLLVALPTVTNKMIRQHISHKPKATIYRLRRHLIGWGVEIHSRRYVGYWIEDKDKARLRAYVRTNKESS